MNKTIVSRIETSRRCVRHSVIALLLLYFICEPLKAADFGSALEPYNTYVRVEIKCSHEVKPSHTKAGNLEQSHHLGEVEKGSSHKDRKVKINLDKNAAAKLTFGDENFCGGTIYNEMTVVSAELCVSDRLERDGKVSDDDCKMQVLHMRRNVTAEQTVLSTHDVHLWESHPRDKKFSRESGLAVLHLSSALDVSSSSVYPACSNTIPMRGQASVIVQTKDQLTKLDVEIVNARREYYIRWEKVIGLVSIDGTQFLFSDLGSPVVGYDRGNACILAVVTAQMNIDGESFGCASEVVAKTDWTTEVKKFVHPPSTGNNAEGTSKTTVRKIVSHLTRLPKPERRLCRQKSIDA